MLVNRRTVRIEWANCDAAGIVFYPNYFAIFDSSTHRLFEAAGWKKRDLIAGALGTKTSQRVARISTGKITEKKERRGLI